MNSKTAVDTAAAQPSDLPQAIEHAITELREAEWKSGDQRGSKDKSAYAEHWAGRLRIAIAEALAATPPAQPSDEPVLIENDSDFCEAAGHCLMSSEMDLRHQGMALRDFALPALEYARFKLLCAAVQPIKTPGVSVTIPRALVDDRYARAAPAGAGEPTEPSASLTLVRERVGGVEGVNEYRTASGRIVVRTADEVRAGAGEQPSEAPK